jgi:hypothetical protein
VVNVKAMLGIPLLLGATFFSYFPLVHASGPVTDLQINCSAALKSLRPPRYEITRKAYDDRESAYQNLSNKVRVFAPLCEGYAPMAQETQNKATVLGFAAAKNDFLAARKQFVDAHEQLLKEMKESVDALKKRPDSASSLGAQQCIAYLTERTKFYTAELPQITSITYSKLKKCFQAAELEHP